MTMPRRLLAQCAILAAALGPSACKETTRPVQPYWTLLATAQRIDPVTQIREDCGIGVLDVFGRQEMPLAWEGDVLVWIRRERWEGNVRRFQDSRPLSRHQATWVRRSDGTTVLQITGAVIDSFTGTVESATRISGEFTCPAIQGETTEIRGTWGLDRQIPIL